jgi:hypothetical protein
MGGVAVRMHEMMIFRQGVAQVLEETAGAGVPLP